MSFFVKLRRLGAPGQRRCAALPAARRLLAALAAQSKKAA